MRPMRGEGLLNHGDPGPADPRDWQAGAAPMTAGWLPGWPTAEERMSEQEQVLAYLERYRRFVDVKSRLEDALRTADRLARLLLEARGAPQEEVDGILAGWPGSEDMVRAVSQYREARAAL